jgi:hypothetical protein
VPNIHWTEHCYVPPLCFSPPLSTQTDLLLRLKTEINAWDKVAERHPYSVYRKDTLPAFSNARKDDPFTTSFGEGLPFRTYDRNQRARSAAAACRTMEQPFPRGYTGHVGGIRHVVGQTYGRQVRDAINSVTPLVEKALYDPKGISPNPSGAIPSAAPPSEATVSTQQLAYLAPAREIEEIHARVHNAVSTRRPVDLESRYASTSQLSYKPPPPRCYATPGWSERPTSNIGQPDVYKHAKRLAVHQPVLPKRLSSAGATMDRFPPPMLPGSASAAAPARPRTAGTITKTSAAAELSGL